METSKEFRDLVVTGIFNKQPDAPLTIIEHALLKNCLSGQVLNDVKLDFDDPDFLDHLQAYAMAREFKKKYTFEYVKRDVANRYKRWQVVNRLGLSQRRCRIKTMVNEPIQ